MVDQVKSSIQREHPYTVITLRAAIVPYTDSENAFPTPLGQQNGLGQRNFPNGWFNFDTDLNRFKNFVDATLRRGNIYN